MWRFEIRIEEPTPPQSGSPAPAATIPNPTNLPLPEPSSTELTIEAPARIEELIADLFSDVLVPLQTHGENPPNRYGDIAVVRLNGTGYRQLTTYRYNREPVLSPDRMRIAYRSVPSTIVYGDELSVRLLAGNFNIWVITVDGEQAWQLTAGEQPRSIPIWSPDSQSV